MAAKSITIDVGAEFIKICESQKNGKNTVMVHQAVSVKTPEDAVEDGFIRDVAVVADTIRGALQSLPQQGKSPVKQVTFVINTSRVATKEVVLPLMPNEKIQEMINMNASDYFPVNIEDYVLSYTKLEDVKNKNDKKTRILVFAAPEIMVQSYYSLGQMLDVKIKAVDYAGNSALQLIKIQIDEKPTMVVQLGMDNTVVSIMNQKILQLQRTVPYGESMLVNSVKDEKNLSSESAVRLLSEAKIVGDTLDSNEHTGTLQYLMNNVNRIIEYYSGRNKEHPLEKLVIVGEGADVKGMDTLFTNETGIMTESISVLRNVSSYNRIALPDTTVKQYMTNIGASINPINFRLRGDEKAQGISHGDMQYVIVGLALAAVGVLLTVVPTMQAGTLAIKKASLKNKIEDIQDIEKLVTDYDAAKLKYEDVSTFYSMTEDPNEDAVAFMEYLEKIMTKTMRVDSMTINSGVANIGMACAYKKEVAHFINAVEKYPYFEKMEITHVTETGDKDVTFNCAVTFKKGDGSAEAESESQAAEAEKATEAGNGEE